MTSDNTNAKKILITTALPYVNNIPHLGNLVPIISADVYARFQRLMGREVLSVLGTDEHGTTTEVKALAEGKTPKEICDEYYAQHKAIYDWFNTEFDCVGRSSSEANKKLTQKIFLQLQENGYVLQKTTKQYYDETKNTFLADRFVIGTCPECAFTDARGDQCDNCGKLLEPENLINPKSSLSDAKPVLKETTHFYIDLEKLQPKLAEWIAEREKDWTKNAQGITHSWLKKGLKPRAITRDLKWGISVPGADEKVFYSWFDAPIAYIGITQDCIGEQWKNWWLDDTNVELVQFMGKDNTQFHTILFPSYLLGTNDPYTFLEKLSVNEYLNYEGGKFSKSRGVGVFGDTAMQSGIVADAYRFYMVAIRPESEDSDFSWQDFANRLNKELIGNYGNLVNRTISFTNKFAKGQVNAVANPIDGVSELFKTLKKQYENRDLKEALKTSLQISKKANQYFQENEPWKLVKTDEAKAFQVLADLVSLVRDVTVAIEPIVPELAKSVYAQLQVKDQTWADVSKPLEVDHKLGAEKPILEKLSAEKITELTELCGDKKEGEEFPLQLKVGEIIEISQHPDADKLYVEKIDLGNGEIRTIVSGLKDYYSLDELKGKKVIVVSNLKAAKLRGIKSQGMILAGEDEQKRVKVLEAKLSKPGDVVCFDGYYPKEDQIVYDEFAKVKMKVQDGNIIFEKKKLKSSIENIKVDLGNGFVS